MWFLTPARTRLTLLVLLLLSTLAWHNPHPSRAADAEALTPLFLGSLSNSVTQNQGPADAFFISLATKATSSIDVALYDFDRTSVREALLAAKARGLTVHVVGDNEAAADPSYVPFYTSLQTAGIPVVLDTRSSLQHNKFAVFDNAVTWTGSANFSDTSFTRNADNVVVITSTVVAAIYTTEFAEMFGGAFSTAKTDNTSHNVQVGASPVRVAFAPTDDIENRIIAALNTAQASIQIAMFSFTSAPIAQALIAARQRGVTVEVLLDGMNAGSQFSQRDALCAAGVTVRVEDWAGKLHDKYAIVDAGTNSDPLILTGSTNWSDNAVRANDENLLIVQDASLANAYVGDFTRLRAAIGPEAFTCNVETPVTPTIVVYLPLLLRGDALGSLPRPSVTPTATDTLTVTPMATATPSVVSTISGGTDTPTPVATDTPTQIAMPPSPTSTATETSTTTPTTTPTIPLSAGASITFIEYDPLGDEVQGEYVVIKNTGSSALDMMNWTLRDLANHVYAFPTFTLAVGAEVRIWTGSGTNNSGNLYWGREQAVWNNEGDTASLRNAQGVEVSRYSYP